jgi:multiple sugar transport system ATP-binding protein
MPEGEVFLGVRPEDLLISAQKSNTSVFEADVYVVEPMGPTVMVDLRTGEQALKSIISSTTGLVAGNKVWVGFEDDKIHIFDENTEVALS